VFSEGGDIYIALGNESEEDEENSRKISEKSLLAKITMTAERMKKEKQSNSVKMNSRTSSL
jgi:hypothetical protein